MPEQAVRKTNPTVMIALVVVLLVLAAAVVYLFTQGNQSKTATTTPTAATQTQSTAVAAATDDTPFDAATATKVPSGQTPEEYLNAYFVACEKGDWETAFNMLPLGKKNYYQTADAFGTQLAGYGISAHKVTVQDGGTDTEVVYIGSMTTSAGEMGYPWTFVKVDGDWYLKTRGAVAFM